MATRASAVPVQRTAIFVALGSVLFVVCCVGAMVLLHERHYRGRRQIVLDAIERSSKLGTIEGIATRVAALEYIVCEDRTT